MIQMIRKVCPTSVGRWPSPHFMFRHSLRTYVLCLFSRRKVIVIESEDHASVALSSGRSSASAAFERVFKIDVDPRLIGYKPENVKLLGKNFPLLF